MIVRTVFPASHATLIEEKDDEPPSFAAFLSSMDKTASTAHFQAFPVLFSFVLSRIQLFFKRFTYPLIINHYPSFAPDQNPWCTAEARYDGPAFGTGTQNSPPVKGLYIRTICSDLCFF
jgi:hypothetical protein